MVYFLLFLPIFVVGWRCETRISALSVEILCFVIHNTAPVLPLCAIKKHLNMNLPDNWDFYFEEEDGIPISTFANIGLSEVAPAPQNKSIQNIFFIYFLFCYPTLRTGLLDVSISYCSLTACKFLINCPI